VDEEDNLSNLVSHPFLNRDLKIFEGFFTVAIEIRNFL